MDDKRVRVPVIRHGRTRPRFLCKMCRKTFSPHHGTPLYRRRTPELLMTQVITLVGYPLGVGCPPAAIQAALVEQPLDL